MSLYIALCLAATLAEGIGEPRPVWSSTYTLRIEGYGDNGYLETTQVWVDTVNNRTRTDYIDGQEKLLYNLCDDVYKKEIVHEVYPVTTETVKNVQNCSIYDGIYAMLFESTLDTLPDMSDFHYIGREWMHGKDATKWKAIHRMDYPPGYYQEVIMWVYDRKGVSVPLRALVIFYNPEGTRNFIYLNYYDYDGSEIDPEVWNIAKGLDCRFPAKSDLEKNSDLAEASYFVDFSHYKRFPKKHKLMAQIYKHAGQRFTDLGFMHDQEQGSVSRQSKALPFPYTPEEVKQLSDKLPEQFDWRLYGAIGPTKNSYYGIPNYASTAAGVVEGALFLQMGRKFSFAMSAQAIVDCSWGFGNRGAAGGSLEASFEWMMKHGLPTDANYPYIGLNNDCNIDNVEIMAKVKAYHSVTANDKNALKVALVNHGPVSIAFDGFNSQYGHGFFNNTKNCKSDPGSGDVYGVLIGYGLLDGEEYWIIKVDSIVTRDYVLITTRDNTCGVMNTPYYVTLE